MNILIEKNYISEMECGSNFSYILNDSSTFLSTEYKVLQSQANSCFVKCMKMMYNGKMQLFYLTKGLKSFASMLPSMDAESFLTIVSNLLSNIVDVKHNGFLDARELGLNLIDAGHYSTENVVVPVLERMMNEKYPEIETKISRCHTQPEQYYI